MDRASLKRLILRAATLGARQLTPFEWEWDISGRCETPVRRDLAPRAHRQERKRSYRSSDSVEGTFNISTLDGPSIVTVTPRDPGPYIIHLTVRCRKCDVCRKERATMWARNAITEIMASERTWFGTLTLRPEELYRCLSAARSKAAKRGRVDFDALAWSEQFALVHQQAALEITLMLKRLRKQGHRFRYMLVAEAHQSGAPHYHVLLHEVAEPIRKATLDKAWPLGFSKWKLADRSSAWYVCKYLAKNSACRVRASLRYGKTPYQLGIDCEETVVKGLTGEGQNRSERPAPSPMPPLDGAPWEPIPPPLKKDDLWVEPTQ